MNVAQSLLIPPWTSSFFIQVYEATSSRTTDSEKLIFNDFARNNKKKRKDDFFYRLYVFMCLLTTLEPWR